MCGPADYVALQTCLLRAAELSAAGLTAYTLHGTLKYLKLRRRRKKTLRASKPLVKAAP